MSQLAGLGIDTNPGNVGAGGDAGVQVALDHAFANLAGDPHGSAFDVHKISSAQEVTATHIAAGNLPNVFLTQKLDISQAPAAVA